MKQTDNKGFYSMSVARLRYYEIPVWVWYLMVGVTWYFFAGVGLLWLVIALIGLGILRAVYRTINNTDDPFSNGNARFWESIWHDVDQVPSWAFFGAALIGWIVGGSYGAFAVLFSFFPIAILSSFTNPSEGTRHSSRRVQTKPGAQSLDYPDDWETTRRQVYKRDGYHCQNCQATDTTLHAHHIVPLSAGGSNSLTNLVTLCEQCHELIHPHMR